MYETAPVSAIGWIGTVNAIRPYKDTVKYEVILTEKRELPMALKQTKEESGRVVIRAPRYSKMKLVEEAKTLADIF